MSELTVDLISNLMEKSNMCESGVSFKGKALVLNKEEDWSKIIDEIKECENLEFLNLEGNTLGVDASMAIAKALESKPELKRALWKDIFTGRMKEEIPKALINLGNGLALAGAQLTELDMSDNAFGPVGLEGLVGLLSSPTCYQLQELKLNNNGLGISGGKMLSKALLHCYDNSVEKGKPFALKVFIAGRNRLENEGAVALAKVFKTLGSLEEVSLPQNGIYSKGIEALSKSFVDNKNLKIINLNDNTLGKQGAMSIANALPHLQKLKVLNLGDCLVKTEGAMFLSQAIEKKHTELEELYMCFNEIGKLGGIAVAEAVKNKNKLKVLSLNGNYFGNEGCNSIKHTMKENKRISCLQSLSDDEGDDEDNDEDNDTKEGYCDSAIETEHDGNESENEKGSEISGLNFNSVNITSTPKSKKKEPELLRHSFQNLSFSENDIDSLNKFLSHPVVDNFKGVDKKVVADYIQKAQTLSEESYFDTLMQLIMKISQFSSSPNDDIKTLALEISYDLYKDLFRWANDKNQTAAVNNSLMVNLGLIKSEDKNFKINWNTEDCLSALEGAISKKIIPESTVRILHCCRKIKLTFR